MKTCADILVLAARVAKLPLFAGLPASETERILRSLHARLPSFPARAYIPDASSEAHVVLSGRVNVRGFGLRAEDRHLVRIASVGEILRVGNVFPDLGGAEEELQMRTAGEVLTIDAAALYDLWLNGTVPAFSARLMALVGEEIRRLRQRLAELACYETSDRLLLHLRHHAANARRAHAHRIAELAELLAVNRTALYRTATKLVEDGWLANRDGQLSLVTSATTRKV